MIKTPLSTVIGGAFWTPGATVVSGQQSFSQLIKKLFSNGEQGFFYDPNDLSTMYQDANGTIPVTGVGQAVGLIRDKSGRNNHAAQTTRAARPIFRQKPILGSELLPSYDFNSWAKLGGATTTATSITITELAGGVALASLLQVGKTYKVSLTLNTSASNVLLVNNTNGITPAIANATQGRVDTVFTATNTGIYIRSSTGITTVTSMSIKEVTGYHTGQNYVEYDGVDDKLITNLPAQLTGCTVIRSVLNVGTQILTGQTIPATYEDNTDHCGLIVINRALTPSETTAITAELNKRAGV